jgi:hypothetical protein
MAPRNGDCTKPNHAYAVLFGLRPHCLRRCYVRLLSREVSLLTTCLAAIGLLLGAGSVASAGYVAVQVKKSPTTSTSLLETDSADLSTIAMSGSSAGMAQQPSERNDRDERVRELPTIPCPEANSTPPGAGVPPSTSSAGTGIAGSFLALPVSQEVPQPAMLAWVVGETTRHLPTPFPSGLFRPPRCGN